MEKLKHPRTKIHVLPWLQTCFAARPPASNWAQYSSDWTRDICWGGDRGTGVFNNTSEGGGGREYARSGYRDRISVTTARQEGARNVMSDAKNCRWPNECCTFPCSGVSDLPTATHANAESLSGFTSNDCNFDHPTSSLPLIIVKVFAISNILYWSLSWSSSVP